MNLIEAAKSGRPFRRPGWHWIVKSTNRNAFEFEDNFQIADISSPDDIFADDWEIKEPAVTITRSQLWFAYDMAYSDSNLNERLTRQFVVRMARHLGLEK